MVGFPFPCFSPVGVWETQHHHQDFSHKFLTATGTKIMMLPLNSPAHQWHIMVVILAFFLEVFHLVWDGKELEFRTVMLCDLSSCNLLCLPVMTWGWFLPKQLCATVWSEPRSFSQQDTVSIPAITQNMQGVFTMP